MTDPDPDTDHTDHTDPTAPLDPTATLGPKGRARRAQILAAAGALYAEGGRSAATVAAICARAGIKRTAFYRYFDDAGAAIEAAVSEVERRLVRAISVKFHRSERGLRRAEWLLLDLLESAWTRPGEARLVAAALRDHALTRTVLQGELRGDLHAEGGYGPYEADATAQLVPPMLAGLLDAAAQRKVPREAMHVAIRRVMAAVAAHDRR